MCLCVRVWWGVVTRVCIRPLLAELFTARTLLEELERHAPGVLPAVRQSVADRTADLDFIRLGVEAFKACPSISIDYAVAERTSRAAVVPADCRNLSLCRCDAVLTSSAPPRTLRLRPFSRCRRAMLP